MSPRKKTTAKGGAAATGGAPSFEAALERLEAIVTRLEEGEVPLEESIEAYAEGTRLVRQCLEKLAAAEATIRDLSEKGGGFSLEPSILAGDTRGVGGGIPEDDTQEDEDGELPF